MTNIFNFTNTNLNFEEVEVYDAFYLIIWYLDMMVSEKVNVIFPLHLT
jgi:hypothetical protein